MKRIGYIGLGIMGSAMAHNLMRKGFDLTVWNRTSARAQPLLKAGALWAESPAQVAGAVQALCINVTDTPDVEQVLFGPDGVATAPPEKVKGLVVIDHSTISPKATREFAIRLGMVGIEFLDAPVSGGDVGAQQGTLSIMVGGRPEIFQQCLPIFQAVGKAVTHVGSHGAGQACKACNQILCALNLLGLCEAMALAVREGLDLKQMLHVTGAGAGASWSLANLGPRIASGDMSPGFMVDLIVKDLAIVLNEAEALNLNLDGTDLVAAMFNQAAALGHGRSGTQALSRVLESANEFKYVKR